MRQKIDLHTHTNFSDGAYSPVQVLNRAKRKNIDIIGIVDHDCVDGLAEAINIGKEMGMEVVPGIEISTDLANKEIHILGYFIDYENKDLLSYLEFFTKERYNRALRMVQKLNGFGIPIRIEDVQAECRTKAIGRPHIADALLKGGYTNSFYEAFNKYIYDNGPAYEKKVNVSPESAIKIIRDAGGLSFIAHPGKMPEVIIKELIELGIDGIETIHPSHNQHYKRYHKNLVKQYNLLESGGSDFHGGNRNDEMNLGKYYISSTVLNDMKDALKK